MTESLLPLALLVYLLAGTVKGTLGIGLPTTAVSLMAQFGDARTAVALAVIPMLVSNAWQVYRTGHVRDTVRRFWLLGGSMLAGIGLSSQFAVSINSDMLSLILGAAIVLFALLSLWREPPPIAQRFDRLVQLLTGSAAGVMGGIAGIWAPPIIVYLSARRLAPEEFVRVVGLLLASGCVVLAAGYWNAGIITPQIALPSLLLVLPAVAGFAIGERLRGRLSGPVFRRLVLLFFLVMGLNLIRRSFGG